MPLPLVVFPLVGVLLVVKAEFVRLRLLKVVDRRIGLRSDRKA